MIPLHDDGVVIGDNAVLACVHTYAAGDSTQCNITWDIGSPNQTRETDGYLKASFSSKDQLSTSTIIDRHILIIPNVTRNDTHSYKCSVPGKANSEDYHLLVHDPLPPQIQLSNPPKSRIPNEKSYSIVCNATGYPIPTIQWLKNSMPVNDCLGSSLPDSEPCFNQNSKNSSTLTLKSVERRSEGKYNCTATSKIGINHTSTWIITGTGDRKPEILNDSSIVISTALEFNVTGKTDPSDLKLKLTCYIAGWPVPNVTWFRKERGVDTGFINIPNPRWPEVQVIDENELIYNNVSTSLDGVQIGCSEDGELVPTANRTLKIIQKVEKEEKSLLLMIIWLFVFIGLIIASAFIIMYFMISKESDFMEELIQEFHKGRKENLNSDLEPKEKAECLPYNREYEFPRSNLKLGKRLGSGAFGLVMFGEANGIVRKGLVTPVAVKMVKNNYEISQIRALASELKIMQTIGKHLNIVNLLGACTDNLKNLLVITEYCSYGNLHEFLLQNRNIFVSQVDCGTGIYTGKNIKSTILQEMMSVTYVESDEAFAKLRKSKIENDFEEQNNVYDDVAPFTEEQNNVYDDVAPFTEGFCPDKAVDRKSVFSQSDSKLLSDVKDMPKPEAVSNHYEIDLNVQSKVKFDKIADISKICTDDLFCWAYQIARGMEYLSSRKIIHGDLAIRNVLLANHNIVKISDFGLSKNVYHYADENYVKKSKQALPVKWMALESIADRVFSTHSDVWTYGIVLWELFSLAETPYAGMDDFERLFHKLKLGFRMERPPNATSDLYNLMLECWNKEPRARPSFTSISRIISDMLEKTLRDYYIGLMEYIEENPNKIYEDYYQEMCYKKQSPLTEETTVGDAQRENNTDTNTLVDLEDEDIAITPGYLNMQGNS
ncbi:hypothetical protein LSTR_LSTR001678 [Laodelphax striatellus]|uniref:receptor protein-tyrosine kinase n=1 Tax=Laodelphax striatellus TaxID=195883 RepID=A0A482XCK2_LAOST|nr:hypothetical protein LSTR_LSTR001678 [Laodelphax striatellus]